MKRSFSILLGALMVLGLVSFNMVRGAQVQKKPVSLSFIGTVESVTMADLAKGTKSEIVVVNISKLKRIFLVVATTTLYNAKGEAITLDKIQNGNRVNVTYSTTAAGVHEAISVKIVM